ncbi:MAG: DUF445 family protein [Syntrophomonas sp.]
MKIQVMVIPIISAVIGYLTNVVAIKLLFWPKKPINLRLFRIYGLLPKRQAEIAAKLGDLIETQLLSMDELVDRIDTPETNQKITARLSKIVRDRLASMMPSIVPGKITQLISDNVDKILRQEAPQLIKQIIASSRDHLNNEIKISKMVEDKVNAFDLDELEAIIKGVSSRELTFIEVSGGVLGFIIGIVQAAIILLFP